MKMHFSILLFFLGLFPLGVLAESPQIRQGKTNPDTCYDHELTDGNILKICVTEQECSFGASSLSLSQESSSLRTEDDKKVNVTVCQEQEGISQDSDREETEEDVSRPDHIPYEYFDPAWHGYDNNSQYYQDQHNVSPEPEFHPQSWYHQEKKDTFSSTHIDSQSVEESSSTGQNESESWYSGENSQFRHELEKNEATYHPRSNHRSQSYAEQQRDLETQVRSRQGSTQGQIPDRPQVEILDHSRSAHTSDQETYGRPSIEPPEHSRGSSVPDHSHNGHNPRSTSSSDFGRSHR